MKRLYNFVSTFFTTGEFMFLQFLLEIEEDKKKIQGILLILSTISFPKENSVLTIAYVATADAH